MNIFDAKFLHYKHYVRLIPKPVHHHRLTTHSLSTASMYSRDAGDLHRPRKRWSYRVNKALFGTFSRFMVTSVVFTIIADRFGRALIDTFWERTNEGVILLTSRHSMVAL
ncbi:MAG: hypothetical protein MHMPM18_004099 [Marteilia pararefringens]